MRCSPYLSLSNLPHLHNADLVPAKREMISAHGKLKGVSERSHPHDLEYAPYVEVGTGKYAKNGNGRDTP